MKTFMFVRSRCNKKIPAQNIYTASSSKAAFLIWCCESFGKISSLCPLNPDIHPPVPLCVTSQAMFLPAGMGNSVAGLAAGASEKVGL